MLKHQRERERERERESYSPLGYKYRKGGQAIGVCLPRLPRKEVRGIV